MTREEASIIIGNIPINGDGCYSISEYQQAKARAIEALEQQPCEDAVSRQAVIKLLSYDWANRPAHKAVESVRNLPSVTSKGKTGHWKHVQNDNNPYIGNLHCSECDRIAGFEYEYCPNCGARMVSE